MAIKWRLVPQQTDWDQYWENRSLAQEVQETMNSYQPLLDVIDKYLDKNGVFFDGGCGLGRWPIFIKGRGCPRVIGLDNLHRPLQKLKEYDPEVEAVVGTVLEIPLRSESVDYYFSGGVIEHFEEGPQQCLSEAHRILKKDGILLVSVPYQNVYRSTIRRWLVMPMLKLIVPKMRDRNRVFYQYYYSQRDLRKFLSLASFEILEWFYSDFFHTPNRRIGIFLELPFLRKRGSVLWELNRAGMLIAWLSERISQGIFAGKIAFVVRKTEAGTRP